jgi:hypothetical protein
VNIEYQGYSFSGNNDLGRRTFDSEGVSTVNGAIVSARLGPTVVINGVPRALTLQVVRASGSVVTVTSSTGRIFADPVVLKSVRRADGLPDACGDVPDEFDSGDPDPTPDPTPDPVGGPIGYPFPDFDITVNPDGTINIDFGDGLPPVTVDPGLDDDGGGGAGGSILAPGLPGETEPTGSGGTNDGEAGEGEELVGVLVRVLSAPPNANTFDNVSATVIRGVGYVAMGYPGRLGVDPTAAVLESPQFFHAQQRGLTAWRVRANVGFNLETTPYYREIAS